MDCTIPAFKDVVFDNLFTFETLPLPGSLVKVPYPVWDDGEPVTPDNLEKHSCTNYFDIPKCYHSAESVLNVRGRGNGKTVSLVCGEKDKCNFKHILKNPTLVCRMYRERGSDISASDVSGSSTDSEFVSSDSVIDDDSEEYEPNSSQDSSTEGGIRSNGTDQAKRKGSYSPPSSEKENPYHTRVGVKRRRLHPQAPPLGDLRGSE
ncbi:hypothetical protein EST38_g5833 [Candolleomyces aberdarensis]|uniref:Uncharacterized protein n=1 Tax=Candolleomyces aberdarensis TaxID=2316362 RepID=A0A4Q2DMS2_9AGAR|nr:hypothetical protein EST38_g5833 [Candolleomyces aberdarensis]